MIFFRTTENDAIAVFSHANQEALHPLGSALSQILRLLTHVFEPD